MGWFVAPKLKLIPISWKPAMKRFYKATAAALAGAAATVIGSFFVIDRETLSALQTVATAALVWLVPNVE